VDCEMTLNRNAVRMNQNTQSEKLRQQKLISLRLVTRA